MIGRKAKLPPSSGMGTEPLPPGADSESKMHGREFPGGFDDYRAYQKKLAACCGYKERTV
jgi:hypothetical protein